MMYYIMLGTIPSGLKSAKFFDGGYNSLNGMHFLAICVFNLHIISLGTIPSSFGSYTNLQYLNLIYNSFTGMIDHLPTLKFH